MKHNGQGTTDAQQHYGNIKINNICQTKQHIQTSEFSLQFSPTITSAVPNY